MDFILTNHAKKRMIERDTKMEQIKKCCNFPDYTISKGDKFELYKKFGNKLLKIIGVNFFEVSISDIKDIEIEKLSFGTIVLTIIKRTDEQHIRLPLLENMKETKSKISNLILGINN